MSTAAKHASSPPQADRELTILQRIAAGEQAAVTECLTRYGGLVWTLAKRCLPSAADAEDASQEIFLELWQKAHVFDPQRASEETFIAMLARRRLIDRRRRAGAGIETVVLDQDIQASSSRSQADQLELRDEAAKAAECMEKLSSDQRRVLSLSIHHGRSQTSIAEMLEMPLGTVKSFARRGLIQLRDCMGRSSLLIARGVST